MSQLQNVLAKFRKALAQKEEQASTLIFDQYARANVRIRLELNSLLEEVSTLGQKVTENLLYRKTRLENLLRQTEEQISLFAGVADPVVRRAGDEAIALSVASSTQLVTAALGPVPKGFVVPEAFTYFSPQATHELIGRLSDPAPTTQLFRSLAPEAVTNVRESLVQNLILGKNPKAIAGEVSDKLDISLNRARTILRTEQISGYRQGNIENYKANADVVPRWRWTAALNSRTCAMCLAMDGKEFPADYPFGTHPSCRCAPVPVTVSWEELGFSIPDNRPKLPLGEDWFNKQPQKTKLEILGISKLKALESGEISFQDLIGYREDPTWGPNRWERSLIGIRDGRDTPPRSSLGI